MDTFDTVGLARLVYRYAVSFCFVKSSSEAFLGVVSGDGVDLE